MVICTINKFTLCKMIVPLNLEFVKSKFPWSIRSTRFLQNLKNTLKMAIFTTILVGISVRMTRGTFLVLSDAILMEVEIAVKTHFF